jgi:hypothetical protein
MAKSDWTFFENIGNEGENDAEITFSQVPQIKNGQRGRFSLEMTFTRPDENPRISQDYTFLRETPRLKRNQDYSATIWLELDKEKILSEENLNGLFLMVFGHLLNASSEEDFAELDYVGQSEFLTFLTYSGIFVSLNEDGISITGTENFFLGEEEFQFVPLKQKIIRVDFYNYVDGKDLRFGTRIFHPTNNGKGLEEIYVKEVVLKDIITGDFEQILDLFYAAGRKAKFTFTMQLEAETPYDVMPKQTSIVMDDIVVREIKKGFTWGTPIISGSFGPE